MSDAQALADAVEAFQDTYLTSAIRETAEWQAVLTIVSELEALSGVEFEQECALQEAAFVHGAQSCREMLARFVENSPPTDLRVVAGSMRANWHPGWGNDPGKLKGSIPHNAFGETEETDALFKAIATGSGTAETNEDSAQCEASQSGGAKTPHRPEQSA